MTIITSTNELPHGYHRMISVRDEAEAEQVRAGRVAYFFRSNIIRICYLFIPAPTAGGQGVG